MPLTHYSNFSMFSLRIWVFKSGVFKKIFILSKHGTNANIRSTKMAFATSSLLKQHWLPNRRLSTRTVRNRLKSAVLKSRRVIKRPLLADRHRRTRLAWCLVRSGSNLKTWRKIHWSDESRFLLHVTDGLMRVWRHKIQSIPKGTSSQLSLTVEV